MSDLEKEHQAVVGWLVWWAVGFPVFLTIAILILKAVLL